MDEEPFEVATGGGVLRGHRGGAGPPALLLHGGPAFPDYLDGVAAELGALFTTMRYTQRGVEPSLVAGPYTIEQHMADALAVLDRFGIDRAWAIGHSWGGHLALHLLVAHADRLLGVICLDALGAYGEIFEEFGGNMRRGLTADQVARIDEIEAKRRRGEATEADLLERAAMNWPRFFADPAAAPPHPMVRIGVECSTETNASIADHFGRETLVSGLPNSKLPVLFVHGEADPLPVRTSLETAALIPGAKALGLPGRGHFPWLEREGDIHRAVAGFLGDLG